MGMDARRTLSQQLAAAATKGMLKIVSRPPGGANLCPLIMATPPPWLGLISDPCKGAGIGTMEKVQIREREGVITLVTRMVGIMIGCGIKLSMKIAKR